jgi:predicted MPP superfamily phosphohydrolase
LASDPEQSKQRIGPRRQSRFVLMVLTVAVGIQAPLVAILGHLGHRPGLVVAVAALLTFGFVASMFTGRRAFGSPSRLRLYLVMWPFFVWWTFAFTFAALAPLAWLGALLFRAPGNVGWGVGLGAALVTTVVAFVGRPRLRHHEIAIAGLPASFDGYRIAQISDLHCGPFADRARVDGWVAQVNRLEADLVAVTGDLIANGTTYVPVVAEALGHLRGRDGVFACMGNHDYFTEGEIMATALERAGLSLLRNRGVSVARGGGLLYVAGVDDTWTHRDDLDAALTDRPAGAPVLLLAHDPALFPAAAERGVALTLSGHTHGGQLGVPFFAKRFNLARSITRFTTGLYQKGTATLYVTRGLGTTGLPIRLFVPPEFTLITLRAAPAPATAPEPVGQSDAAEATDGDGELQPA